MTETPQEFFDKVAAQLRTLIEDEPDNEFKIAIIGALQHLELTAHPRNQMALDLLVMVATLYFRHDEIGARFLMLVSGSLVNDHLCETAMIGLAQMTQKVYVGDPKQH